MVKVTKLTAINKTLYKYRDFLMGVFSVIVIILLVILILAFTISLFLTIIFNVRVGITYREPLAKKLHSLRLSKMLTALGINVNEYLHTVNVATINQQIDRCTDCASTKECDDNLSNNSIAINEIDYCNNESSLKDMLTKKGPAE